MFLLQLLDTDVFEFAPHRGTGVKLEGEDAVEFLPLGMFVGAIEDEAIVHEMLDMVAFGTDDDVVEFVDSEELGEFLSRDDGALDFLFAFRVPENLLTGEAHTSTFATFFVNETSNVGQLIGVTDFVLIATDNPFVPSFGGDVLGSVLDTRIVHVGNAKREAKLEVLGVAILPDEKGVTVCTFFLGGLSADNTVLDRPESRVTGPTCEVLAIEDDLHVIGFSRCLFSSK